MKHSIIRYTLVSAFAIGLTACGGGGSGGGGSTVTKFDGNWKGPCETVGSRSYKQTWDINGDKLDNNLQVWSTNNCAGTATPVKVKAALDYKNEISVANTCAGGKAQEVDITYQSVTARGITITGEDNIKGILASKGISNALPKYGLICKGNDGKLYRGLVTTDKDASTPAKRPDEMDTAHPLVP